MGDLKYIMFDDGSFLIFPLMSSHAEVARGSKVSSAGFVNFVPKEDKDYPGLYECEASCFGESTTLGIKSNEEQDSRIISMSLIY